jgi:hypothetical protein
MYNHPMDCNYISNTPNTTMDIVDNNNNTSNSTNGTRLIHPDDQVLLDLDIGFFSALDMVYALFDVGIINLYTDMSTYVNNTFLPSLHTYLPDIPVDNINEAYKRYLELYKTRQKHQRELHASFSTYTEKGRINWTYDMKVNYMISALTMLYRVAEQSRMVSIFINIVFELCKNVCIDKFLVVSSRMVTLRSVRRTGNLLIITIVKLFDILAL